MDKNAAQRTKPIFKRLDEAIREVRKATTDQAEMLEAAMGPGTSASFASVHVAHLNLVDTVHRLVLLMDVARRSTNISSTTTNAPAFPSRPTGVDAPARPVVDPFAVAGG